jgi:ATP synthase protein I
MSDPDAAPAQADPLVQGVQLRAARRERWLAEGGASVGARLAQIGVLGWIVVTPMLAAVFGGRWLDGHFHSGIFWTAPLLMLGAGLGCWSAWTWMKRA